MKYWLIIIFLFTLGCTESKKSTTETPVVTTEVSLLELTKYYFAGSSISTNAFYTKRGIDLGDVFVGQKITKTLEIKNGLLMPSFFPIVEIQEQNPKIFNIDSNNCSFIPAGGSCSIVVSAFFSSPSLITGTKTVSLKLGEVGNSIKKDLFVELYANVKSSVLENSNYLNSYNISISEDFDENYSSNEIQERVILVTNNSSTRWVRGDFINPELVGSNPTDFYISLNECSYPLQPLASCRIKLLYKKWQTESSVPDTEIKMTSSATPFSLKFGVFVSYTPSFSDYGSCSRTQVCTGLGVRTRTITTCLKNGVLSVDPSFCSGETIQQCGSPAGIRDLPISGGVLNQSCAEGSISWVSNSATCNTDFHAEGLVCVADTFIGTYSDFVPNTNPNTEVCSGTTVATRNLIECRRVHNSELVDNSKCTSPLPTLQYRSPFGTRTVDLLNTNSEITGVQNQSCSEGQTNWVVTSVSCNSGFHRVGNLCEPNVYIPTFGDYSPNPVTTVCSGQAQGTRSIISCTLQHTGEIVSNSLCSDPVPPITYSSPSGTRTINLFDSINVMQQIGVQEQFCAVGEETWSPTNTSCSQYYSSINNQCVGNTILNPTTTFSGTVDTSNLIEFVTVNSDLNTNQVRLYDDIMCSNELVSLTFTGGSWIGQVAVPANGIVNLYAQAFNTVNSNSSSCVYLYSYRNDNIAPTGSISINNGESFATSNQLTLNIIALDNFEVSQMKVSDNNSCTDGIYEPVQSSKLVTPGTVAENVEYSIRFRDAVGNESLCYSDSIFNGITVNPKFAGFSNWNTYVKKSNPSQACDGSESAISTGIYPCLHAGEMKTVELSQTSCLGLTLNDELNIFKWTCNDSSGRAIFTSKLNGKLSSAIDISGSSPAWRQNRVILSSNSNFLSRSAYSFWWQNPIQFLVFSAPNIVTYLNTSGTVYVVNSSTVHYGLQLSNNTSLVVMPGITTTLASNNNCETTKRCVAYSNNGNFIYLEGILNSDSTLSGIYLKGTKYALLNYVSTNNGTRGLEITNSASFNRIQNSIFNGASMTSSNYNTIYRTKISNTTTGFPINLSNNNSFSEIQIMASNTTGFNLSNSSDNYFSKISASNSSIAILATNINNSKFSQINSSNNSANALDFNSTSSRNNLLALSMGNNALYGIRFNGSSRNILSNAFFANISEIGLGIINSATQNLVEDIAFYKVESTNANNRAITLSNSFFNKFDNQLMFGLNTGNCVHLSGADSSSGLIPSTCISSGLSTASNFSATPNLVNIFRSQGVADSATNIRNLEYDSFMKSLAINDISFGAFSRGSCTNATCFLYDWSLASTDNILLSKKPDFNSVAPGFIIGQLCPQSVNGDIIKDNGACLISNNWSSLYLNKNDCEIIGSGIWAGLDSNLATFSITTPKTYLKNAIEIIDPEDEGFSEAGNHDGLCETGESCLYTPNIGAYQGHGAYGKCEFNVNGGINGVTIWGHELNGY